MHPLIAEKLGLIKSLCQRHAVARLWLIGSGAEGSSFDPSRSDVDFVVEFLPEAMSMPRHPYFDLLGELERLLGRRVDLISDSAIENRYFRRAVESTKVAVYAAA